MCLLLLHVTLLTHSIMEMDPNSAAFQRIFSNVFAYTAFKSTEPWLVDYVTLDLHEAMQQVCCVQLEWKAAKGSAGTVALCCGGVTSSCRSSGNLRCVLHLGCTLRHASAMTDQSCFDQALGLSSNMHAVCADMLPCLAGGFQHTSSNE